MPYRHCHTLNERQIQTVRLDDERSMNLLIQLLSLVFGRRNYERFTSLLIFFSAETYSELVNNTYVCIVTSDNQRLTAYVPLQ